MSIPVPPIPSFPPAPFTLTSVTGLRAAGVKAGIKPSGNPDVALLASDAPMVCAGLFTQNHFAAAPVTLSRQHLAASKGLVRAVVINSGNANACTGADGDSNAAEMAERVAKGLGCPLEQVLVCSTGVIGVKLPMDKVRTGIDAALAALSTEPEAGRRFLSAIMTTDAFPKEAGARLDGATFAGVCKGAGMIQPNMATMLAFVGTDVDVSAERMGAAMKRVAATSFNAVHVDTHTSTNDTFLMLSTRRVPAPDTWEQQLETVARRLAWLIARDGEGATKVTTVHVLGAASDEIARTIARTVASSALVRTALFGNDPNWGRFVSQVGNVPAVRQPDKLVCRLQGVEVFRAGEPTPFDRAQVSKAMAREDVSLEIVLDEGQGHALLMTSDLGYRYVQVNAEYTT